MAEVEDGTLRKGRDRTAATAPWRRCLTSGVSGERSVAERVHCTPGLGDRGPEGRPCECVDCGVRGYVGWLGLRLGWRRTE